MKLPGKTTERYSIPGTADEDGDSIFAEPVPVRKRDFLRVLFGRYRPQVFVSRPVGTKKARRIMRETWSNPRLRDQLYAPSPMLDALEGNQGAAPIVKRGNDEA